MSKANLGTPSKILPRNHGVRVDLAVDRSAHTTYLETTRFGSLDGVRGLCILAVIFHHVPGLEYLPSFFHQGFLGVDAFFVLSGLLIETLLLRERSRLGSFSLGHFYIRRALRIFPIYYGLLAAIFLVLATLQYHSDAFRTFARELPFYLTYTSNWIDTRAPNMSIFWSLATEEQFYLVWPFVEKFASRRASLVLLIATLAANQAVNFGALAGWEAWAYGDGGRPAILQITFTPILLGVALARFLHEPRSFGLLYRVIGGRSASLVVGGLLLGTMLASPSNIQGAPRLLIQVLIALLIASVMIREDHWAAPALRLAPLRHLGTVSYGAYLYHMLVLHLVRKVLGSFGVADPWVVFAFALAGTYAVATLSFRVLEAPLLRLKDRFARSRVGSAAVAGWAPVGPVVRLVPARSVG